MRQETMTAAERMKVLGTGQHPNRVPITLFALGFCAKRVGYSIKSVFEDPEKSFFAQLWTREMYGIEGGPSYSFLFRTGLPSRSTRSPGSVSRRQSMHLEDLL